MSSVIAGKLSSGHEKEIIKVISVELDEVKRKYDEERTEKEVLKQQLDKLMAVQDNAGLGLMRANEVNDKLRLDNRRKEDQLNKLQKTASLMEDRIKQLELRASEVDQAEIGLETTKKTLEQCKKQLADEERQFRVLTDDHRVTCKKLAKAEERNGTFELKVGDLNQQVRQELMRNEKIEKELDGVWVLKDELEASQKQATELTNELQSKTTLLCASRRALSEMRDNLKNHKNSDKETVELKQGLEASRHEVDTLKQIMAAKDTVVLYKSRALDMAHDVINVVKSRRHRAGNEKMDQLLEKCSLLLCDVTDGSTSCTTGSNTSFRDFQTTQAFNGYKYHSTQIYNGHAKQQDHFSQELSHELSRTRDNDGLPHHSTAGLDIKSRMKLKPTLRNKVEGGGSKRIKSAPNNTKEIEYSKRFFITPKLRSKSVGETRIASHSSRINMSSVEGNDSRIDSVAAQIIDKRIGNVSDYLPNQERGITIGQLYSLLLRVGDRVKVRVTISDIDIPNSKAAYRIHNRYGKTGKHPQKLCRGIIKYIGYLEEDTSNSEVFIGLQTDGSNKVQERDRYSMYGGALLPITHTVALFDVNSACYINLRAISRQFRLMTGMASVA